mgnify:CR=1 FL=1
MWCELPKDDQECPLGLQASVPGRSNGRVMIFLLEVVVVVGSLVLGVRAGVGSGQERERRSSSSAFARTLSRHQSRSSSSR